MRFLVAGGYGCTGPVLAPLPRAPRHQADQLDVAWKATVARASIRRIVRAVALLRTAAYPHGPESM